MHIIQEEIGIPKIKTTTIYDNHVIFTIKPLPAGFGVTIGNTMRRVLLSSLPGACATGIKIEGVNHEYTTIKGVKESILNLALNVKMLNIKKETSGVSIITLESTKEGELYAKDIECKSDVEIINKDLLIATLDKGAKIKMEIRVEKGVGYEPAKLRQDTEEDPNMILIDAIYSPVKKVRYEVNSARVGQMTNLDELTLEVETNGSISPEDAIKFSSNVITSYFNLFNENNIMIEEEYMSDIKSILEKEKEDEENKPTQESYTPIEILAFSPRTLNALINGGIGSIEQLSKCTESKLSNLRGFGKKALTEVSDALSKNNLTLAED